MSSQPGSSKVLCLAQGHSSLFCMMHHKVPSLRSCYVQNTRFPAGERRGKLISFLYRERGACVVLINSLGSKRREEGWGGGGKVCIMFPGKLFFIFKLCILIQVSFCYFPLCRCVLLAQGERLGLAMVLFLLGYLHIWWVVDINADSNALSFCHSFCLCFVSPIILFLLLSFSPNLLLFFCLSISLSLFLPLSFSHSLTLPLSYSLCLPSFL